MMQKVLLLLGLLVVPALAQGATYYTVPTGNDTNSCRMAQSLNTPKKTIKAGVACLKAGDTLIVQPGTYNEVFATATSLAIPAQAQ